MSISQDRPTARLAGEMAGLVVGREPPETVERLRALADRLGAGGQASAADRELVRDLRHRYGRELAELEEPEP